MPDFLTDTGEFTDEFRTALPEMMGDEHKDSKVFDDIPGIGALVKSHLDTKAAVGKKLDNVIQKPADGATDEVKAAYRAELATASGAPAAASEYDFFKSEKLPEGMVRSQETEDKFRQLFFEHKTPKATVLALSKVFEEIQTTGFNALMENDKVEAAKKADAEQKAFDERCAKVKTDWPGDKLPENARMSLAFINKFGSDELKAALKAANMYENAADLAAWVKAGVPLDTLQLFHAIVVETGLDAKLLGGGTPGPGGTGTKKTLYARTKAQLGETE